VKVQAEEAKAEQEKEVEQERVFAATAKAHKYHKSSMSIAKGALNCDEVVKTLQAKLSEAKGVVQQEAKNVAKTKTSGDKSKSQMVQGLLQQLKEEKMKTTEALKAASVSRQDLERSASFVTVLKERIANLHTDGSTLSKGLRIKEENEAQLHEVIAKMTEHAVKVLAKADALKKKADMLETCQKEKTKSIEKAKSEFKTLAIKLEDKVTQADTKASISKRGYELCQANLIDANAASNAVKATAMQTESQLADQMANQAKLAETLKTRITASVSQKIHDEEREIYETKLDKAVNKLSQKKPMSPKCKVCAKLSGQEKIDLKADCGVCGLV